MLSVALVGFGWWGRTIASRLKENSLFELVCVVEPNSDVHSDIKEMGLKPILDFIKNILSKGFFLSIQIDIGAREAAAKRNESR